MTALQFVPFNGANHRVKVKRHTELKCAAVRETPGTQEGIPCF